MSNLEKYIIDVSPMEYYQYIAINDLKMKLEQENTNGDSGSGIIYEENCSIWCSPIYEELFYQEKTGEKSYEFKNKLKCK